MRHSNDLPVMHDKVNLLHHSNVLERTVFYGNQIGAKTRA